MKMYYQRTVSNKDMRSGEINTQRFSAEQEIDVANLEPLAKQKVMQDAADNLNLASAVMLKKMVLDNDQTHG